MLIKKPDEIKSSEITDKKVYLNRRLFMRGAALLARPLPPGCFIASSTRRLLKNRKAKAR